MSRGRNHKEDCGCPICTNTKTKKMGFQKGYSPTKEQRRKQSETRKRLFAEGKLDMKEKMSDPRIRKKISESNKIKVKLSPH